MPASALRPHTALSWVGVVCLTVVAWSALHYGSPAKSSIELVDVTGEGAMMLVFLGWSWALSARRVPKDVGRLALLGVWMLLFGTGLDLLDELFFARTVLPQVLENLSKATGGVLASAAMWMWHRRRQQHERKLHADNEQLSRERYRDALTGLFNRAALDEQLLAASRPVALVLIDIDDFKHHNDTWGHPEGDLVIQELAQTLEMVLRDGDPAFRYGGEEFAVLLPGANEAVARRVGERIRATFADRVFQPEPGVRVQKTLSIGLAGRRIAESTESWLRRADQAMYRAKHSGKNCVATGREILRPTPAAASPAGAPTE